MPEQSLSSRRAILQAATALGIGAFASHSLAQVGNIAAAATSMMTSGADFFAYVGSRTTKERNARGSGINVYRVDGRSSKWTPVQTLDPYPNPSYLALDRERRYLYCVHGDLSDISAFRIDGDSGKLTAINRATTQGKNPVHLAIDSTNRFIVVANHLSSTLVVIARGSDGSVGAIVDEVKLEGKIGPHRIEQPFAKPHQVEFDRSGQYLVVPDKGLDQVFVFRFDSSTGKLTPASAAMQTREGAGPRHVAFQADNRFAYVVNELDSTVIACRFDAANGKLDPFQVLTTLPDTFVGNSRASEIAVSPDGRFVLVSNRGYDSIATFSIDAGGRLSLVGCEPSGGRTPRFFAFDPGQRVIVANEDSDEIVPFGADARSGKLLRAGDIVRTGSPVCIVFRPALI
jgi:6-phosphogluconolactonase (cycloisomerase 2 family)